MKDASLISQSARARLYSTEIRTQRTSLSHAVLPSSFLLSFLSSPARPRPSMSEREEKTSSYCVRREKIEKGGSKKEKKSERERGV